MEDLLGFRKRLVEASAAVWTPGPCHVDYKPKVYSPRREGLAHLSRLSQPAPQSTEHPRTVSTPARWEKALQVPPPLATVGQLPPTAAPGLCGIPIVRSGPEGPVVPGEGRTQRTNEAHPRGWAASSLGTHEQVASWLLPEATESPCPEFYPTPPSAPPSGVMPLIPNVSGNPGRPRPNCWDPRTNYQRKDHQRLKFRTSSRAMRFSQKVQFYNYVHLYIFTLYI